MALNISGRMKVKTLRADFLKEFGLTLRVYEGRSFADDDATLASIRKGDSKGGEFSPKRNTKVGNLEDKIEEMFGIKTQVSGSDDSYLCDNDLTLAGALEADEKKMGKKLKKASKDNGTSTTEKKIGLEEIVEKIQTIYVGHDDLDEMIGDLQSDGFYDYWANKMSEEDFPANLELAKALYTIHLEKCDNVRDLCALAEAVSQSAGLNDKIWAKEILTKALTYVNTVEETIDIADQVVNKDILNDKVWALTLYKEASQKLDTLEEYNLLIDSLLNNLEDYDFAKTVTNNAVLALKNTDEMFSNPLEILTLGAFVANENIMNDPEKAKEIFEMNKTSDDVSNLLSSASKVREVYGDIPYASEYTQEVLDRAIEFVKEAYYCDIYDFFKYELEDDDRAKEFMDEYYDEMKNDYEKYGGCEELFEEDEEDEEDENNSNVNLWEDLDTDDDSGSEKYRIYLKSEPSGEYCLGKLSSDNIEEIKSYCGKETFENTSYIDMPFDYDNMGSAYGVSFALSEFAGANLIEESFGEQNNSEDEPGFYLQATAPTKMSVDFTLDVSNDEFDISKLTIRYTVAELPLENSYGDVLENILVGVEYDGKDYTEEMRESIVDSGYSYEVIIFEVEEGNSLVFGEKRVEFNADGLRWRMDCTK